MECLQTLAQNEAGFYDNDIQEMQSACVKTNVKVWLPAQKCVFAFISSHLFSIFDCSKNSSTYANFYRKRSNHEQI